MSLTPPSAGAPRRVQITVGPHDAHRLFTWLAVAGLLISGALALLGLPKQNIHGVLHYFGIMDPLCGGTRAVRLAVLGQWSQSWHYNPLGIPLLLGAGVTVLRAVAGLITHRWVNVTIRWTPTLRRASFALLALGLVALGIRQQLLVDLLTVA